MKNKEKCSFCGKEIIRYKTKTNNYFCDTECKANWQKLQRENKGFTKDWLIHQYFDLEKTCNQIAKEINKN